MTYHRHFRSSDGEPDQTQNVPDQYDASNALCPPIYLPHSRRVSQLPIREFRLLMFIDRCQLGSRRCTANTGRRERPR
jgi:hypothetical protein